MNDIISLKRVENRIIFVRGQKVMLSTDLAELYDVEPKVLVQSVKRNIERFPEDFMFQLSHEEFENLKSQIVTSSWGGIRRATPCKTCPYFPNSNHPLMIKSTHAE